MKRLYIILTLSFFSNATFSQIIDEDEFDEKMEMKVDEKNYSWAHKNLFVDAKLSAASELFVLPIESFKYISPDYSGDPDPDTTTFYDGGLMITLFSVTLEPRINLVNRNNSAFYIKSPLSIGFSLTTNGDNIKVGSAADYPYYSGIPNKRMGFFSINLPIMLGYARGLNSTFQNTSDHGFAFSAGYQLLMTPLVGGTTNIFTEIYDDYIPIDEPYEQRKKFGMPIVQIDYFKQKKGSHKIRGYSLAVCPYGNIYFKLGMNFGLSKK